MPGKLQEGIYHASGQTPGKFFNILFLKAGPDANTRQVLEAFATLWDVYQELKAGRVKDLPGHPVPSGNLSVLVGYGVNLFKLPSLEAYLPYELQRYGLFRSPLESGGGPLLIGSGLRYGDDVRANRATEEITVQVIGETQLSVHRAVVETWKTLHDMKDPLTGSAPIELTCCYSGFQRDDRRSWIDFHDGISNMKSQDREGAIAIKSKPGNEWIAGGTYLVFLRLAINLASWRALNREQQELLVGRSKYTGCPLLALDDQGNLIIQPGCTVPGTDEVIQPGNVSFFEPLNVREATIRQSHVQRANHHLGNPSDPSSRRIFRQGYEYLQTTDAAPGFQIGLNFISFQDTPLRLLSLLTQGTWLGGTNFGGDPEHPLPGMDQFISVLAGGVYLVPPLIEGEGGFPGSSVLMKDLVQ